MKIRKKQILSLMVLPLLSSGLYFASDFASKGPEKMMAHADMGLDQKYFCSDPFKKGVEVGEYRDFVRDFNNVFVDKTSSTQDYASYMTSAPRFELEDIGIMAECLSNNGVDPNSVAKLDSHVLDAGQYAAQTNPEKLYQMEPAFAHHFFNINRGSPIGFGTVEISVYQDDGSIMPGSQFECDNKEGMLCLYSNNLPIADIASYNIFNTPIALRVGDYHAVLYMGQHQASIDFSIKDNQQTDVHFVPEQVENQIPSSQSSNSSSIPSWIKNNAKWWHDGSIGDSDFIKGIQYMIQNGIISIPQTQQGSGSSQSIPSWIKNNAGYWGNGQIADDEFVKGIQYLIQQGIIKSN